MTNAVNGFVVFLVVLVVIVVLVLLIMFASLSSPVYEFTDGKLTGMVLRQGITGRLSYQIFPREKVYYHPGLGSGNSVFVFTSILNQGFYEIDWVAIGNQNYTEQQYLQNHPEVLAKANQVLELGRQRFAEAQAKLVKKLPDKVGAEK